jgi:hypothetical protein
MGMNVSGIPWNSSPAEHQSSAGQTHTTARTVAARSLAEKRQQRLLLTDHFICASVTSILASIKRNNTMNTYCFFGAKKDAPSNEISSSLSEVPLVS